MSNVKNWGTVKIIKFTIIFNILNNKEVFQSQIQSRSQLTDEYWNKFETVQDEIEFCHAKEEESLQKELGYRTEMEELYFEIVTIG